MRRLAAVQSNYIPWKGYFDLINLVDEFVLLDNLQYTRCDWRNRNRIQTRHGLQWLSIPVTASRSSRICDVETVDNHWRHRHWMGLVHNYGSAPYFDLYRGIFESLYLDSPERRLSRINRALIEAVNGILGINTRLSWAWELELKEGRNERLIHICRQRGATEYLSGPAARDYLDETMFRDAGIQVRWMSYEGYPQYGQSYRPFEHAVSIVDLLFNQGPYSAQFMLHGDARQVNALSA
jgi:hypothetical protein